MSGKQLDVMLCWHMHQPEYRDLASGEFRLPWVYLHAIKDYCDMAAHAEAHPGVRMVFNFVPVLLEQLEDYAQQFARQQWRDPLLAWLCCADFAALPLAQRRAILQSCFRVNHETMLQPFEGYRRLYAWAQQWREAKDDELAYISHQFFADAVTWHHLSWTGETVRRAHPQLLALMQQGGAFTLAQRRELSALLGQVVADVVARYRRLAERGQIELSTTPYFHPIAPLMLDFKAAREAWPEAALPPGAYPGGGVRAQQQLTLAIDAHARFFAKTPQGVWPAEGGVSSASAELLAAAGVRWIATGEAVLANSLKASASSVTPREHFLYTPYAVGKGDLACFFRDDKLSDRIGFEYAKWHADDAVRDFVGALEQIAKHAQAGTRPLVSIILDGENAWEYYPFNGYYFISQLYTTLEHHPHINTTTPSAWLSAPGNAAHMPRLRELCAGSWVYGTFSTWIGAPAKNRAWELLCEAKRAYDETYPRLDANAQQRAQRQLGVCEGSDWFWWFGDYNAAESVASFDALYRANLRALYQALQLTPPETLAQPINVNLDAHASGGAMRRSA